jgi:hypothetical protein
MLPIIIINDIGHGNLFVSKENHLAPKWPLQVEKTSLYNHAKQIFNLHKIKIYKHEKIRLKSSVHFDTDKPIVVQGFMTKMYRIFMM